MSDVNGVRVVGFVLPWLVWLYIAGVMDPHRVDGAVIRYLLLIAAIAAALGNVGTIICMSVQ